MVENQVALEINDLFISKGTPICIDIGYRLCMHDLKTCIYLESGDLDLFALEPNPSASIPPDPYFQELSINNSIFIGNPVEGMLTYLGGFNKGSLLFPFGQGSIQNPFKMLIKANTPVKIRKMPIAAIDSEIFPFADRTEWFMLQVDRWFEMLCSPFPHRQLRTVNHYLETEGILHLQPDDTIASFFRPISEEKPFLQFPKIKILSGCLIPINIGATRLTSSEHLYPIVPRMWLKSIGKSDIQVIIANGWPSSAAFLSDFLNFQEKLLVATYKYKTLGKWKRQVLLAQQESIDRSFLSESLKSISSIFTSTPDHTAPPSQDNLFKACQLVAQAIRETLVPLSREYAAIGLDERLYEIAVNSNLHHRKVLLSDNWWKMDVGPLVGFLRSGREPVALIHTGPGKYLMINPAHEQIVLPMDAELSSQLEPMATMFYRAFPDKAELTGKDIFQFCIKGRSRDLMTLLFIGLIGMLFGLFFPFANSVLFDQVLSIRDSSLLLQLVIGMGLATFCSAIFMTLREYTMLRIESYLSHDLDAALWQRLLNLPPSFFRIYPVGDLIQRVSAVREIRKAVSGNVIRIMLNAIFSTAFIASMFYYSPQLTLVALSVISISIIAIAIYFVLGLKLESKIQNLKGIISGQIIQIITGLTKIRSNGVENRIFAVWAQAIAKEKQLELSLGNMQNVIQTINVVIPVLAYLAIFYTIYSTGTTTELITMGSYFAFNTAFLSFSSLIFELGNTVINMIVIFPAWKRANVVLKTAPEFHEDAIKPATLQGDVRIENVSFRYNENSPYVLKNISMQINRGEFIGVVGPLGCGKSTIIRLLLGFETPEEGAVYYDGKDLASLNLRDVRSQLGVVMQNSQLLDGTIRENVTGGTLATDAQVMEAITLAGFQEDLEGFPMGLRTPIVAQGSSMSGGQRQRLLIARALMNNAKIVILDEATNALDNQTQKMVISNLNHLEITRIMIAHRLSTIRNADRIYVMSMGEIVETGTFAELAARQGLFAKLLEYQKLKSEIAQPRP